MARLAVAAVLLTLLLVALCRVIDGEVVQVAAYPSDPAEEEAVLPDGAYVEYNGAAGTSIAFVPPHLDAAARDEAVAQSYVLPAAMSPEGPVIPVDDADQQGFLRFPCRYHCRYRHMRWARRHGGLYRRHGEGFHGKEEKQLVAEMPVEPVTHGEELSGEEAVVVVPVAEPDPDTRQDAADEPVHGEEDEMARFHHGRLSHHHHRHHHHHDEHEEDEHEQADEASPVERSRFHRRRRHHHHHHDEDEHEQREDDDEKEAEMRTSKRFHHHRDKHDDSDDDDELEEMAKKRWIRKALMRSSKIHHHGHRFHHHRAEGAAAGEEEEEGGVMSWLKDFVNRF
uniref:Uncharacterized protein n=1 Tax=Oryza punctata TaxID=4537 RepID=A0A0E0JY32_ORYPU